MSLALYAYTQTHIQIHTCGDNKHKTTEILILIHVPGYCYGSRNHQNNNNNGMIRTGSYSKGNGKESILLKSLSSVLFPTFLYPWRDSVHLLMSQIMQRSHSLPSCDWHPMTTRVGWCSVALGKRLGYQSEVQAARFDAVRLASRAIDGWVPLYHDRRSGVNCCQGTGLGQNEP